MPRRGVALLVVATVACACGGGGGGGNGSSATPAVPHPPFLLEAPQPRTVDVALDASRSAKADIPITGGSLSVTAADGTVFSLTIPDKALMGGETVRMTPVGSLRAAPLSVGPTEGVQIEPEGLLLFAPATLTITPKPQLAPTESRVGFGYTGSGSDFHLELLDAGGTIILHLMHFSGYGVGGATPQDVQQQAQTPPSQSWDQEAQFLEMAAHQVVQEAHDRAVNNQPVDQHALDSALQGISEQYWKNVAQPLLEAAKSDPSLEDKAMLAAMMYIRRGYLGSGVAPNEAEAFARIRDLVGKQESRLKCDVARGETTATAYVSVVRKAQFIGNEDSSTAFSQDVRKCLRFQLDFASDAQIYYDSCPLDYHIEEKGLLLEPDAYSGQTTLTFNSNNIACGFGFTGFAQTQPFTVSNLRFDVDVTLSADPRSVAQFSISRVLLFMRPGQATTSLYNPDPSNVWDENVPVIDCEYCWTGDHGIDRVPPAGDFIVHEWTYPATGAVVALAKMSREVDRASVGVVTHDTSTFTLTMAPA